MLTSEQKAKTIDLLPTVKKIDAIQMAIAYNMAHREHIDWHEFSYYLDHLQRLGLLNISKPGGMVEYKLGAKGS